MNEYYKDEHRYDDILYMPHHQSKERPHMSLHDRAAQFAPFAALSGHEEAIEETARITDERIILDASKIEQINEKLSYIASHLKDKHVVSITYFKPDSRKKGGAYLTDIGVIKKFDESEHLVIMESGMKILLEQIVDVEEGNLLE